MTTANNFVKATPVLAILLVLGQTPGAPYDNRSPTMRAERAKLKSWRDDMKVAQGKRGTSAALG